MEYAEGTGRINWGGEILIPTMGKALKRATESSSPFLLCCLLPSIVPGSGAPSQERWGPVGESSDEAREMLRGAGASPVRLQDLGLLSLEKRKFQKELIASSVPKGDNSRSGKGLLTRPWSHRTRRMALS